MSRPIRVVIAILLIIISGYVTARLSESFVRGRRTLTTSECMQEYMGCNDDANNVTTVGARGFPVMYEAVVSEKGRWSPRYYYPLSRVVNTVFYSFLWVVTLGLVVLIQKQTKDHAHTRY